MWGRAPSPVDASGFNNQTGQTAGGNLAGLIWAVAAGDRDAFEELYRCTSATLFAICLSVLANRQQAEDALQDAYLSVWRRAESFDETAGRPMTWLCAVARNRAIDVLRKGRPTITFPISDADDIADARPCALATLEAGERQQQLVDAFGALDRAERELLTISFLEGATYREIAQRSSLPLGTVKSRVRRALLKLRASLGEEPHPQLVAPISERRAVGSH